MKQIVLPANSRTLLTALVILTAVLFAAACITLPRPAQPVAHAGLDVPKTELGTKLNINTASPEALEALPGVGRGIAERIVAHRQQYGPFRRAEHLMMVRGVSDRKFRQLRAMIVVE